MKILLNFPTPDQLINISTAKLTKILKTASKGRFGEDKAFFIKDIAFNIGLDGFIFELQNILNQIKFIESQIKELYLSFDSFLHTITGIGFTNAAIILSENW